MSKPVRVGRRAEQASLRGCLSEVIRTRAGCTVLMTGVTGVGKTTVCNEFLAELGATDGAVWLGRGRCLERSSDTDPLAPILETLDSLRRLPGDERARLEPESHVRQALALLGSPTPVFTDLRPRIC